MDHNTNNNSHDPSSSSLPILANGITASPKEIQPSKTIETMTTCSLASLSDGTSGNVTPIILSEGATVDGSTSGTSSGSEMNLPETAMEEQGHSHDHKHHDCHQHNHIHHEGRSQNFEDHNEHLNERKQEHTVLEHTQDPYVEMPVVGDRHFHHDGHESCGDRHRNHHAHHEAHDHNHNHHGEHDHEVHDHRHSHHSEHEHSHAHGGMNVADDHAKVQDCHHDRRGLCNHESRHESDDMQILSGASFAECHDDCETKNNTCDLQDQNHSCESLEAPHKRPYDDNRKDHQCGDKDHHDSKHAKRPHHEDEHGEVLLNGGTDAAANEHEQTGCGGHHHEHMHDGHHHDHVHDEMQHCVHPQDHHHIHEHSDECRHESLDFALEHDHAHGHNHNGEHHHHHDHGECEEEEGVICLAVVREDGTDISLFDASGNVRSFSFKGDIRKLCFSSHGQNADDLLTPCFDEAGNHGIPQDACFCGVETAHLHAHIHDPRTCDDETNCGNVDLMKLARLTLFPTDGRKDYIPTANVMLEIPVSEVMPKECNSRLLRQMSNSSMESLGKRMHRVRVSYKA